MFITIVETQKDLPKLENNWVNYEHPYDISIECGNFIIVEFFGMKNVDNILLRGRNRLCILYVE